MASEPVVSNVGSSGQLASGLWTYSSTTPNFSAFVEDAGNRYLGLGVEVEHDPSAAGQGSGSIWVGQSAQSYGQGEALAYAPSVPSGKLQDGWLVRWRVRGLASNYSNFSGTLVPGPWSEWQAGKVDTSKPIVSNVGSSGQLASGLWTYSSLTPNFSAVVEDAGNRYLGLGVEVEHDPSAAGQGSGSIWVGQSAQSYGQGEALAYAPSVPSGKLQDGWLVRWRVRGLASNYSNFSGTLVPGPWSEWQVGKVDTSKPIVSNVGSSGQLASGLWTYSSLTPNFSAVVEDADNRYLGLGVEVEHDPSAAGQGSGPIWTGRSAQSYGQGEAIAYAPSVPSGKLQDGWLVRWRVRGLAANISNFSGPLVAGPWSEWQVGRIDTSKPIVSNVGSSGQLASGLWTYSSLTPNFSAFVEDAGNRYLGLGVEVEHDPSAAGQGSGPIWVGQSAQSYGQGEALAYAPSVPSGKLQDGWLIRWRVRGLAANISNFSGTLVLGPWSEWQVGRIDTSKPIVSNVGSSGQLASGLWTYSSTTPNFSAFVEDAGNRYLGLGVEVEHDPSAAGQGSGSIWAGQSTQSYGQGEATAYAPSVPSGKLQDGWLIRWRVRGLAANISNFSGTLVPGPWSEWQTGKIEVNKPAGSGLGVLPATQGAGLWTLSSLMPQFYMKVTSANGAASYLGAEVEHDPSAASQGSGLIWAGKGSTSYASGSNAWLQVPAGKLTDGWSVRWRVQGVTTSGVKGAWSEWQSAKVDLKKPSVAALGMTPATAGSGLWMPSSVTPWVYAKVTDPENRASYLGVEVEHDPSATGQGSGRIFAGTGTTSYSTGSNAWLQIPLAKLSDGWLVRWRVQGVTTSGVKGPWSEWQSAKVDLKKPSVEDLGMDPAVRGTASWTAATLTPWLYAKVTDPENRPSYLGIEVEHDPSSTGQGTGQIYAGKATTSYPSGSKAWMAIPPDKLKDGWLIRWRTRAVTTSGVNGSWSDWQFAKVSALPFETFAPANNTQVGTLTPTLSAHARPLNEAPVTYWFQVCAGTQPNWTWCESSPDWVKSGTWTVPEKKLKWGETYWWYAKAATSTTTVTSSWRTFTPTPEQGVLSSSLASGTDGREFNHLSGNYTRTETDLTVTVAGPPLTVVRTYNSLDPRTNGAFGSGWSTRWDMRIESEPQTSTLLVTYPAGEQLRFAAKGDGTYASPPGTYATLVALSEGGWRLMDKSATSYWFDTTGRLTKITDNRNRNQELTYGSDGKLAKATGTGGRSLTFAWTGAHVTSVSTDPVNGAPLTWSYTYDGDKLVKVCPPNADTACATYTYGDASRYRSTVLDSGPAGYWRLNETATATGTKIVNSAGWNITSEEAKLTGSAADVASGVPGPLTGSPDTAMRFKGTATSTYVSLPQATISGQGGNLAVEAWFKTTGSGTVIGYQNSASNTPSAFTPGVYVGTDGKLRGQFYTGTSTPITSAAPVNDGTWHHVVLSGAEDTQTLFLDGQIVGTLAGKITHVGQWETRIGAGFGSAAWPTTTGSTAAFPFAGDIDEVAVYGKPLGVHLVKAHYAARSPQPQLTKAVAPSGRTDAENVYAADGGRLTTHTDANGGAWKLSAPAYSKETTILTFATTTVTDPHGGTLTYVDDALRGNRPISRTDQLDKSTKYTYDIGGFPAKVFDPNGNIVEASFNARGNLLAKKTCRTADSCSSEYFTYYLNVDDPFDPRNDLKTSHRDARSASAVDETYMTVWAYNAFGEEIKQTTPPTADFPQGRSMAKVFTDGTEPAVGGGLTPAGLVRSAKDFKGNETTYAFTAAGDLATETSPTGLVKKYEHDALGRLVTQTEISRAFPDGVKTTITYDGLGKVTSRTGTGVKNDVTGVTHTSQWTGTYDADGLPLTESVADLTGGDAKRTTTYTYDAYGRVETITGPEGGVQRFGYDHKGQKTSFTDERGTTYHYGYTARGEPATTTLKGWTGSPVSPQPAADVVMTSSAYDPAGRLASQTDAMGRTTAYTYYADNLPFERSAKGANLNGAATARDVVLDSMVYDAAGNLTRQTTNGGILKVEAAYDAAGRLTSQTTDPGKLNAVTTADYDANNNVIKVSQTAAGTDRTEITEYAYDAGNQPVRKTTHNGGEDLVTTLSVDDRGLVTAMTDARGNASGADPAAFTTSMTYNAAGLPTQIQLPSVKVEREGAAPVSQRPTTKLGYNTFGEQTQQVDAEGRTVTMALDRAGRVIEQTFPVYTPPGGQPITPKATGGYDAAGQLVSATDQRGQTTTAVYDALGRKVQATEPKVGTAAAGVWTYGYDLLGEALWTTDPTGARSESTYDDLGRQITLTTIERKPAQAAYVTKLEYDDAGRLVKSIRPTGDVTSRTYDATGALTGQTDALGNTTAFGYDLAGRPVKTTNPLGVSSTASYDLAGRKIQIQELDAAGAVLRTKRVGYDAVGNPISQTSAEGHTSTRVFDAANRLIELQESVSAAEKITSTFGYDAVGAQTRATNGRGHSTVTSYNSLGLVESLIEPATAAHPNPADRTWSIGYDAGGNPVTSLAPGGVQVQRTFDELNRLIKQTGSGAEIATEDKTFGYDLAGRLVAANDLSFTLNDRGLLLKTAGAGGDINAYAYDANNRLAQRVDITGTSTFTWDDADRLTQSVDPVSATTIDYAYDKAARLTSMAYGAGGARRSYTYDPLNRLTKDQLTTSSNSPIASIEYGYDLDDNLTSKTTSGTAGAGTNTYTYDWSNRLTSWTAPGGAKTDYEWDAAGNRIRAGDKTFTYDERNRLTSGDGHTYTYTARGTLSEDSSGMVSITRFDAFDRLINDGTVTYDYDALDRVETRTQSEQTTRLTYDGLTNNLIAVTDANNVKKASFGRDALGRTLGISDGAGAQLAFSDLRGDLIGAFTANGTALADSTAYDPFGEVITRTGNAHTLGYQGGYTDPSSGKINMAARWYQPATGSFVSRDTLTQSPDPSIQLNRYAYANDNPLTNIDPDGHKAKSKNPKTSNPVDTYGECKQQKKKSKTCGEIIADHGRCKDYGKSNCTEAEREYTNCRKENNKNSCSGAKDVYGDCRADSKSHMGLPSAGGSKAACRDAAAAYGECLPKAGRADRKLCRDVSDNYIECRSQGTRRADCNADAESYQRCRQDNTQGYGKGMCDQGSQLYRDCLRNRRANQDMCSTVSDDYVECRKSPAPGGRQLLGHATCRPYAEAYVTCRNTSFKGGKHSADFCNGVQDGTLGCLKVKSMKDCSVVDDWYMKCAQKNGESGCVGDTGHSGSDCPPAKTVADAADWTCEYYLNNQDANLLKSILERSAWGAGICTMFIAVTHLVGVGCALIGGFTGAFMMAVDAANKGHGVVMTYRITNGHESFMVSSQQPGKG
ncbi:RHS repeat-associated core domain-containing protein [Streptosporangium sp. NPDC002544]|uniref:RHS repeat-associated core domain-containing protein n=1 Tax=Streptosporangium sp. NPDC002544 TaxID=3154538 RepID=UPI00332EA024